MKKKYLLAVAAGLLLTAHTAQASLLEPTSNFGDILSVVEIEKGIENLERERIARQAEAERDKADAQPETKKDAAPAQEKEPKKDTLNFITDNASYNPVGEWRQGLYYDMQSLRGGRDTLNVGGARSQGMKEAWGIYGRNVGHSGAKLDFVCYAKGYRYVNNISVAKVYAHEQFFSITYTQPLVATKRLQSEVILACGYQSSESDLSAFGLRHNATSDRIREMMVGYTQTNYGASHFFYQKHSFIYGSLKSAPTGGEPGSQYLKYYIFDSMYRKDYTHGQAISAHSVLQLSGTDGIDVARQFCLGGMYTVRGYREYVLSGDNGFGVQLEYSAPVRKDRKANAFVFFDYGRLFKESALYETGVNYLAGTGVGLRATFKHDYSATLTLGIPLRRELPLERAASARVNFLLSTKF